MNIFSYEHNSQRPAIVVNYSSRAPVYFSHVNFPLAFKGPYKVVIYRHNYGPFIINKSIRLFLTGFAVLTVFYQDNNQLSLNIIKFFFFL